MRRSIKLFHSFNMSHASVNNVSRVPSPENQDLILEESDYADANENLDLPIQFLIKFIKPFDGNREKLPSYLSDCNRAFELSKPKQRSVLLDYTITQITGKAKAACVNRTFLSWTELKSYLKTMYQDTKHKAQLLCELTTLRQKSDESLSNFTTRLETCLKRTINAITQDHDRNSVSDDIVIQKNPEITQKSILTGKLQMLQDIAVNRYTYFTIPEISKALRIRDIRTLNDAIAVAKAELQIQNMVAGQSVENNKSKLKSFKTDTPKMQCRYCKKLGHTINDCRKRAYNNNKSVQIANTDSNEIAKSCNYCKKPGHLIKDCYKRANANKNKKPDWKPKSVESKNSNILPAGAESDTSY